MKKTQYFIEMHEEKKKDIFILRLKGRLDGITSPLLGNKIDECISKGENKFLLNFAEVDYLSSTGIKILFNSTKRLKSLSGKLILCSVSPTVLEVLKMPGLISEIDMTENEEDALQKFF